MEPQSVFHLLAGLVMLILGAQGLVSGASGLALAMGVPSFVVGLTLAAFGTSLPETVVSAHSALNGHGDIALGNVVGSNIFNVLFILGVCALIKPLTVNRRMVRVDVPIMIAVSLILFGLSLTGTLGKTEGIVFLVLLAVYVLHLSRAGAGEPETEHSGEAPPKGRSRLPGWIVNPALIAAGLALLVKGADWFVDGAVVLATHLGVSQRVIGLTVVAMGTSLPELATSVTATLKGDLDIAVGNIVGSNIFNILVVVGIMGILAPGGLPVPREALHLEIPVMLAAAVMTLPMLLARRFASKFEGLGFIAYFLAFVAFLVISSETHGQVDVTGASIAWFLIPPAVFVLFCLAVHLIRKEVRTGTETA